MRLREIKLVLFPFVAVLIGCGLPDALENATERQSETASASAQQTLRVVAENEPLRYLASRLGGRRIDATVAVAAPADPRRDLPDDDEIEQLQEADLILLNGIGYADWTTQVALPETAIVNVSRPLQDQLLDPVGTEDDPTHSHGAGARSGVKHYAPEYWLDPKLAQAAAEHIADAMSERLPGQRDDIMARKRQLTEDLNRLDERLASVFDRLKAAGVEVTATPRLVYLAKRYDLPMAAQPAEAPAGSTDENATRRITLLVDRRAATDAVFTIPDQTPPGSDFLDVMESNCRGLEALVEEKASEGQPASDVSPSGSTN